jgi:hypothetical protein
MKKLFTHKNLLTATGVLFMGALSAQTTVPAETEFKPSGNLWGYVFGDYAMKTQTRLLG